MTTDKFTISLLAAALSFLPAGPARADATPPVPSAWADHAQSRTLEELLYRASQGGDKGELSAAHARIATQDLPAIERIQDLIVRNDTAALQRLSLGMTACHYAGMTIRLLILDVYEADGAEGGRSIAIPAEEAMRFADHMNRCELISRKPGTRRLIGAS
jgi:hypothetical protein